MEYAIKHSYQAFRRFCRSERMLIARDAYASAGQIRLTPISKQGNPQPGAELVIAVDSIDALIAALIAERDRTPV